LHISRFSRESIISQQRRRENTPDYLALTIYHQNQLNACQQKTEGFLKDMLVRGVTADEVLKAMKHAVKGHDKTEGVQRAPETTR